MADPRVVQREDGTVHPIDGFRWCPYCDGQGVVMTMDGGPHLDEHATECGFCDDGICLNPPTWEDARG